MMHVVMSFDKVLKQLLGESCFHVGAVRSSPSSLPLPPPALCHEVHRQLVRRQATCLMRKSPDRLSSTSTALSDPAATSGLMANGGMNQQPSASAISICRYLLAMGYSHYHNRQFNDFHVFRR
ncbi:hypothetical protein J6590_073297 [Homalodisca vitripennis]|nr:hypothetical protein J6590_073297 [Homalodisca vitripennis]